MRTIVMYYAFLELERIREEAAQERFARRARPRSSVVARVRSALSAISRRRRVASLSES